MKGDCGTSYQPDQKYLRRLVAKRKLNENGEFLKGSRNLLPSVEKKKRCDYLWAVVTNDIYETIEEKRMQLESIEERVNALLNDERHLEFLTAENLIDVIGETSMTNMEAWEIANLRTLENNLKTEIKELDAQLKILYNQPTTSGKILFKLLP